MSNQPGGHVWPEETELKILALKNTAAQLERTFWEQARANTRWNWFVKRSGYVFGPLIVLLTTTQSLLYPEENITIPIIVAIIGMCATIQTNTKADVINVRDAARQFGKLKNNMERQLNLKDRMHPDQYSNYIGDEFDRVVANCPLVDGMEITLDNSSSTSQMTDEKTCRIHVHTKAPTTTTDEILPKDSPSSVASERSVASEPRLYRKGSVGTMLEPSWKHGQAGMDYELGRWAMHLQS